MKRSVSLTDNPDLGFTPRIEYGIQKHIIFLKPMRLQKQKAQHLYKDLTFRVWLIVDSLNTFYTRNYAADVFVGLNNNNNNKRSVISLGRGWVEDDAT